MKCGSMKRSCSSVPQRFRRAGRYGSFQKRDTSAEIVLNWNLYNGGSDQARIRQSADLVNQAADQRDKACRDVRQTAQIA